ncbi:MAG: DNA repair protein RecN [Nitrosomonas sp.]|nr:DNA repair protein RecN [Nitrosomonas sp.]MDP1950270.1 DNA repair protein RecN [Nitrosomonas sp.]
MLKHLSIKDFVIVDQMVLDFVPGFTVLTGETGAGKSILIDALSLAMGSRGDADQVRYGCERAEISALFDISVLFSLEDWLEANALQGDLGSCLLRRVIDASGRSRGFINGHAVTLQQMRIAGEHLVDIHGQHAHQSLLRSEVQRDLLDSYAGSSELAKAVTDAYQQWQRLHQQRLAWEQNAAEYQQEREQLEWQSQELTRLNFTPETWQTLQVDHSRLSHIVSLLEATEMGLETLSESDAAAIAQINLVNHQLRNLLEYDSSLNAVIELLDAAQVQLQEGIYELKHYRQRLDVDPQHLQEIEMRLTDIYAAARKYRVAPDELPQLLATTIERLDALGSDNDNNNLTDKEKAAHEAYLKLARELTMARKKAGQSLSQQVSASMQTLAMQGGQFSIALTPVDPGLAHGLEHVEFQVSTHKGLPLKPLSKVVSGGELSRISLSIQVITSKIGTAPTLIFDEVDAGIGGRVAEIVGRSLKKVGESRQVLCITHLPQVASAGDQQWQVTKSADQSESKQVTSRITVLEEQGRIEEIARMLGGMKITETTRKHAVEMLQRSVTEK